MDLHAFGPVWDGAGARGFSGEGYWYHWLVPGLSFDGSTFVSKTITTYGTTGNMPLTERYAPQEFFPDCIALMKAKGAALNSVGLSGPSVSEFLETGRWQEIEDPFFISWMPVLSLEDPRYEWEMREFVLAFSRELSTFRTNPGIQLNISCPNTHVDLKALERRVERLLNMLSILCLPVVVKLSLLVPPEAAVKIAQHPACSGLCIANTIPFGTVLSEKWWELNFPNGSPLEEQGLTAGGLSGAPLLYEVERWLKDFRRLDKETYVNAGGGIMRPSDVDRLHYAGANSVFFASVAMLRPWRVRRIVKRAHELFV